MVYFIEFILHFPLKGTGAYLDNATVIPRSNAQRGISNRSHFLFCYSFYVGGLEAYCKHGAQHGFAEPDVVSTEEVMKVD